MPRDYLHNHFDFSDLIRIVGQEMTIDPALVEKDYWIMHCLYGLQQMKMVFELKGGTSLSKGFSIIQRFSEDIDIRIEPPTNMALKTGRNHDKPADVEGRKNFYDWLAKTIKMDGIETITRDTAFDDSKYRSAGIRCNYPNIIGSIPGLKDGVLLEVGFDDVTPNMPNDISSWAYDFAITKVDIIDNRALAVLCYHPGYTLIEKLQTISTKFRRQQEDGSFPVNFMRHYYDVYCLLLAPAVQNLIGTDEYRTHKEKRFRSGDNPIITENEAFLLNNPATRQAYEKAYENTKALYYQNRPAFGQIMDKIIEYADRL
jgi:hypothetical protein